MAFELLLPTTASRAHMVVSGPVLPVEMSQSKEVDLEALMGPVLGGVLISSGNVEFTPVLLCDRACFVLRWGVIPSQQDARGEGSLPAFTKRCHERVRALEGAQGHRCAGHS